jgi:nucleoside permease NupC
MITHDTANFVFSSVLPILLVVPMFDILTYLGILPFIIKWVGKGLCFITRCPRFESFFAIEMMFLGNSEVIAVSKTQLRKMSTRRNVSIALMSMSCVTASVLGAYMTMMPAEFIITAVPINILGALLVVNLLNPTKVSKEEDVIYGIESNEEEGETDVEGNASGEKSKDTDKKPKKPPFFSFLMDSILGSGKLVLIIVASVISFVSLAALIDTLLGITGFHWLTLANILAVILFPFTWLLGVDFAHVFEVAGLMGTKIVTNEFVVMLKIGTQNGPDAIINSLTPHTRAVLTVFLTSFANLSTLGMVTGVMKGVISDDKNKVTALMKSVPRLLLSGILVSLLSAACVSLFVW